MTHPGGRPLKFKTAAELQKKVDAYFKDCDPHVEKVTEYVEARDKDGNLKKDKNGLNYLVRVTHNVKTQQVPYTITGLAHALGTTRETLLDYEDRDEFSDTIKKAKLRCENFAEMQLFSNSPTGTIFNLKNNYGWRDKTELDGNLNVKEVKLSDKQAEQLLRLRSGRTDSEGRSD